MKINIINETKFKTFLFLPSLKKEIEKIIALFKSDEELTLVITNDSTIQQLNNDYRKKNKATNVLSFPIKEEKYIGDIVISIDTLICEAKKSGKKAKNHFAHLLIHGILHLQGLDHIKDTDANKMEKEEIKLLKKLNIENPYK